MQKYPRFVSRLLGFVLVLSVTIFVILSTGCGSAKHGRVKSKHTGCNCGF
ncbi:MAG: hypothetical protein ORO02_07075 [Bacteroidia bacterium]|nr:hypothetical protein [Bacteroidia bacterium]